MKNVKRAAVAVGAALALPVLATVPSAAADDVPPPDGVAVEVVTVNGSGCPDGTATVTPSRDNTAFTVAYQQYVAWAGGAAPPTDFRKNCQLNVRVSGPDGYTYAVTGIEHRGYAHLEPKASGLKRTTYYFQGDSRSRAVSHDLQGPYDDSWRFVDRIDPADRVYKPCGADRNLNINTEVRVDAGGSDPAKTSFVAMESSYADTVYHLAWKRCSD